MRLQKVIADSSELSRRAAEEAISLGEVTVNGRIVKELGTKVDPHKDTIYLRDKLLHVGGGKKIYLVYNKPKNCIVSKKDPEGRPTIWDRMHRRYKEELNSAGRLDYGSEGLIILTNDGELINRLTHPSHEIWKTYEVKVRGIPSPAKLAAMERGMRAEGVQYLPAQAEIIRVEDKYAWLRIKIREGKNRQVRRMCESLGHLVQRLKRTAIGNVTLEGLAPNHSRPLTKEEIKHLHSA